MSQLIDRNGRLADDWIRIDDEAAAGGAGVEGASVLLTLAQWRAHPARWDAHDGPLGILLGPADDPEAIADVLPRLKLVAVEFPSFTDGRGYSIARLLRQRHGYDGELRAVGDVLRDQMFFYARCGFDTFALRDDQNVDEALRALGDFSEAYQAAVDRGPLFERRAAAAGARVAAGAGAR